MPNVLVLGNGLGGQSNFNNGQTYNTVAATTYLGGTVQVTGGSTLNLNPVLAVGVGTTFNVSNATINYGPAAGISAANTFNVGSGGVLSLGGNVSTSALSGINFTSPTAGPGGTLVLPESLIAANVVPSINGFGVSDTLQIANPGGEISSGNYSDGALHFFNADGDEVSSIQLGVDGDVNTDNLSLTVGADGGLTVVACYLRGTRITTDHGEVAIEDVRIGDRVATVSGALRPVKWIGRRGYSSTFAAKNPEVRPVLLTRGSLGESVPARDLYVSPQHAMFLDGVLVDAELLVNGSTIRRVETGEPVEYFNVEFDTHDVILAEGAPSESFLNRDCRTMFQNAAEFEALYPGEAPCDPVFYARRVMDGPTLAAIRERLDARAGQVVEAAAPGVLEGEIDRADWSRISGWAFDRGTPGRPVTLDVLVDGSPVAQVVANRYRADLERGGFGDGRCSFELMLPRTMSCRAHHLIEVRRSSDQQPLRGAPLLLEALPELSSSAGALRAASAEFSDDAAQLDILLRQVLDGMDRVLDARSRSAGEGHARATRYQARGEAVLTGHTAE